MYDVIIIGLGPAGLTAGIYASRYKLKNLTIGKVLGGMISLAHKVENWPGEKSFVGIDWSQKTLEQVKSLGTETVFGMAGRIEPISQIGQISPIGFRVFGDDGKTYEGKTVIMAAGSERRRLGVPGEEKYIGRGVSYCTTCDAPFFKDKIVAVVGGSDAAVSGSIHASEFAKKVYLIHRRNEFRAEPVWVSEMEKNPKIEKILENRVVEIKGDRGNEENQGTEKVTGVVLEKAFNASNNLNVDGVFIEIGGIPGTSLVKPLGVELDNNGFIKVQDDMSTNIRGFFAAGDLTDKAQILVQMTTAAAQGAIAAASAYKYLKGEKAPKILG